MLNGLTKPDRGRIIIDGETQALINLGAGFDRGISGRENIINAVAMAGVSNEEIQETVSKIIAFSELEEFIDSPVGTYSSGMYARLGFSVATHVSSDIIFIDEILAVGDVSFQNKCFVKMQSLRREGVTMILVSHSEAQITQFCDRAIWLNEGKIKSIGSCSDTLVNYNKFMEEKSIVQEHKSVAEAKVDEKVTEKQLEKALVKPQQGIYGAIYPFDEKIKGLVFTIKSGNKKASIIPLNSKITFAYEFELTQSVPELNISLNLLKEDGTLLTTISTLNGDLLKGASKGKISAEVEIDDLCLSPGKYVLVMPIHEGHSYLYRDVVSEFRVVGAEKLTWGPLTYNYKYNIQR